MAKIITGRYFENTVVVDNKGVQILDTWMFIDPTVLASSDDIEYTMLNGDSLNKLSSSHLGDDKYWWIIAVRNRLKHFWDWKPGDKIFIPKNTTRYLSYIKNNINK